MTVKAIRILTILLMMGLVATWSQPAQAQDNLRRKATKVTVEEPMQIPGTVLAPGEYIFVLADNNSNRHIVEVWNADQTKRIARVMAIPNSRLQATDKPVMTYEERPAGEPVALEAWFYSGLTGGQQFLYPKSKAEELTRLNKTEVPSTGSEEAFPGEGSQTTAANNTARSSSTQSSSSQNSASQTAVAGEANRSVSSARPAEPTYSASAQTPAVAQPRAGSDAARAQTPDPNAPQNSNANTAAGQSERLPNTASPLPLIGLLGSLLISVALLARVFARS